MGGFPLNGRLQILFTPYSAEAHKPLPLRAAKGAGVALKDKGAATDKRNETFLKAVSCY